MSTMGYIKRLTDLKTGDLGKARSFASLGLDKSLDGFDLFTGLWWPLREVNQRAPKREIAWLILKLYGFCSLENSESKYDTLANQLRRCQPFDKDAQQRFTDRFDRLLSRSIDNIETDLQWALRQLQNHSLKLNWVRLTDDLSIWERGIYYRSNRDIREIWANEYLDKNYHSNNREI